MPRQRRVSLSSSIPDLDSDGSTLHRLAQLNPVNNYKYCAKENIAKIEGKRALLLLVLLRNATFVAKFNNDPPTNGGRMRGIRLTRVDVNASWFG
jgi:hypothetical protein